MREKAMNIFNNPIATISGAIATMLLLVAPANAHQNVEQTVSDDNEILVIGERDRKVRINGFIKSVLKPVRNDQYASFRGKICPVAVGLPDEHVEVIETRIRDVAKYSGIKVGGSKCDANMAVVIVNDPKDFFKELRENQPAILEGISIAERNRIMRQPGPAYAWQTIATRSGNGGGAKSASAAMAMESSIKGMTPIANTTRGVSYDASNSRYYKSMRFDIRLGVVLIDKNALEGVTLRQIADYSLMRLIGHTSDVNANNVSERSILSLFTDRAEDFQPPESVTAWDVAFLNSLYKSKGNVSASSQRSIMTNRFDRQLVKIAEESSEN